MFGKKDPSEARLAQYKSPIEGISNRQLKIGTWIVAHRLLLEKISVGVLALVAGITFLYSASQWAWYLLVGYGQDQQLLFSNASLIQNYAGLQPKYRAQSLQVGSISVTEAGANVYNFAVPVTNPNERYIATVTYKFIYSGGETESATQFILPHSQTPVAFLGQASQSYPGGGRLLIEKISWKRIDPHTVPDVDEYMAARLQFSVDDFEFVRRSASVDIPSHQILFTLKNDSAYGYWAVPFYVELLDGGRPSAIFYLNIDTFRSLDAEEIDLRSTVSTLNGDAVRVSPLVNVFDENEFLAPGL